MHTTMSQTQMEPCIEACSNCHRVCLQTALNHCIESGGSHVEPTHFRLMMNCAEICQTSANLQLSNSKFSAALCAVCAQVCAACAESCQRIGGMDACVDACNTCAETCRAMAAHMH